MSNTPTLKTTVIADLAARLDEAALRCAPIPMLTLEHPGMTLADGYAVQHALRARQEARGARITGLKMGLTSQAKMRQVGVSESLHGHLTDQAVYGDGAAIPVSRFIHPRVEAELAVVLKTELRGPDCDVAQARAAIDFVLPAVEIIDSRYTEFRFDLPSVVADNTSAAGYVLGGRSRRLEEIDLVTEGVVLTLNGRVAEVGAGAAVLGDPLAAVAMLANQRAAFGAAIPAGCLVLTGGVTAALHVGAGDSVTVHYQSLGTVRLRFE